VLDAALAAGLVFFSLAFFHTQYTALLMVLVLARWHRLSAAPGLHALQVLGVLLLLFGFGEGSTTLALALPLAPEAVWARLEAQAPFTAPLAALPWPAVGRALLVVAAGGMAWNLWRRTGGDPAPPRGRVALGLALAAWPVAAVAVWLSTDRTVAVELAAEWGRRLAPTTAVGAALVATVATAALLGARAFAPARRGGSPDGQ
jgi:hypothetical protein